MNRTVSAVSVLALLSLAGCGTGYGSTSSHAKASPRAAGGSIHVASTSLGQVLVDGGGRTVYLLTSDSPGRSGCNASCLAYWPAVAPPSGSSLPGVTAAVGRTTTPGGDAIATVGGWPLSTFVKDGKPGDVTGEGVQSFGGTWYAVSPSGQPVKAGGSSSRPSGGSSTGSTGPTYGY
jgi:predicted lipoprotein with Yx(FWY)xxD motif